MLSTPTIDALGQSLDHWQALYIVSVTMALLATFAIVLFAFHIQEHRTGLKISNYFYVAASLLAVVATIVIVIKTKSLDTEKGREAQVQISEATMEAAQANATARSAQAMAMQTANENLRLGQELRTHEQNEQAQHQEENISKQRERRTIKDAVQLAQALRPYSNIMVSVSCDMSNGEGMALDRQLVSILAAAGFLVRTGGVLGPGVNSPESIPGVHIVYGSNGSKALAGILATAFRRNDIAVDESSTPTPFQINLVNGAPEYVVITVGPNPVTE